VPVADRPGVDEQLHRVGLDPQSLASEPNGFELTVRDGAPHGSRRDGESVSGSARDTRQRVMAAGMASSEIAAFVRSCPQGRGVVTSGRASLEIASDSRHSPDRVRSIGV
jgi:hypothetical protein